MRRALAIVGWLLLSVLSAGAGEGPATEFLLENGLRVIVRPIPGAGEACAAVLYGIGEQDDPPGRSGLARLTAQVYATSRAGDVFPRGGHAAGPEIGGRFEVDVRDDHTTFSSVGPADRMRLMLDEVAARMGELRVEEGDVIASAAVVAGDRSPYAGDLARDAAEDRLHPLPGGGRRGGVPEQVRAADVSAVREHVRRFYGPANAVLVVVGNVDPALVTAGVRRRFAPIAEGERPPPSAPKTVHGLREPVEVAGPDVDAATIEKGLETLTRPFAPKTRGDVLDIARKLAPRTVDDLKRRLTRVVAVAFDLPTGPRGLAAGLVISRRLHATGAPEDSDAVGDAVVHEPLANPTVITLTATSDGPHDDLRVVEALRRRFQAAAEAPISAEDRAHVRGFPVEPSAGDDLARVGPSLLRRARRGIDPRAVERALDALSPQELHAIGAGPSAAVAVRPSAR